MNIKIINEFEKLVSYLQENINKSPANKYRLKQIKYSLDLIKKFSKELTLLNLNEFKESPGIGQGTIDRITEIIKTGKLLELEGFTDMSDKDKKTLEELESIVGVGKSKALDLLKLGVKSVKDLKKKIKNGEIEVNEKVQLGIKYHGVFEGNIPRSEITKIKKMIEKIINNLNKKLKDNEKYVFEICGSYRRGNKTSGDIDVLLSKLSNIDKQNHLELFVNKLKEKNLLVDDITDKNFVTKYMGFAKYNDNPVRRIDIRFIPYDSFFSALLYFTGSAELNKKMRQVAKEMGYKLSEYGLFKNDEALEINSEKDVFTLLKLPYLEPNER